MREIKNILGINFVRISENPLSKYILTDGPKKYIGKVVKGRSQDSYFVVTGIASKNEFKARFLNPYFEQTDRPCDLRIPFSHVNNVIEDSYIEKRFAENLEKIRSEIPEYKNPEK
jgi:hypothetical protein